MLAQHRAGNPFVVVFLWKVKTFSVETQFRERQMLKTGALKNEHKPF